MKKIYLQPISQHGKICYIGKIDPRELIKVVDKIKVDEIQPAQRPIKEKRVKEIAKYVEEITGILPNTLTLATKDNRYNVQRVEGINDLFYIEFPEIDSEFANFKNSIDVMDGQHRLYSFDDGIRLINDREDYELGFTLYIQPVLSERQKIFISCNEKQEKVSGNLLMWFKQQLNMLTNEEKRFYPVVSRLSDEYPLKGHIIMSAEKIKNGVKAKEIMATLKQAGVQDMQSRGIALTDEQLVKVICVYLSSWESVVGFSFTQSSAKEAGAAIKAAGLKYMLQLLPTFWTRSIQLQKPFNSEFVKDTLKQFITACGVLQQEFFTCEMHIMCFRDRTAIDKFANDSKIKINSLNSEDFDPLSAL